VSDAFKDQGAGLEILGNENLSKTFSSPGCKTILKTWNEILRKIGRFLSRSLSASNTLFQLGPYIVEFEEVDAQPTHSWG
jgi:hypothetical protein